MDLIDLEKNGTVKIEYTIEQGQWYSGSHSPLLNAIHPTIMNPVPGPNYHLGSLVLTIWNLQNRFSSVHVVPISKNAYELIEMRSPSSTSELLGLVALVDGVDAWVSTEKEIFKIHVGTN